jgi:hypothetical protein
MCAMLLTDEQRGLFLEAAEQAGDPALATELERIVSRYMQERRLR